MARSDRHVNGKCWPCNHGLGWEGQRAEGRGQRAEGRVEVLRRLEVAESALCNT